MECKQMSSKIAKIEMDMQNVQMQLLKRVTKLENDLGAKQDSYEKFSVENLELRNKIAELNSKLQNKTWTNFRKSKTLLIGDSTIRDIDETKLNETKVVAVSGASSKNLIDNLNSEADSSYDKVKVVIGSNDCNKHTSNEPVQPILDNIKVIVHKAKTMADEVTISNVRPRLDKKNDCVELLNSGIQALCEEEKVTYVNNTPSFRPTLLDGTILWLHYSG